MSNYTTSTELQEAIMSIVELCRMRDNIPKFVVITDDSYRSIFSSDPTQCNSFGYQAMYIPGGEIRIYSNYQFQVWQESIRLATKAWTRETEG